MNRRKITTVAVVALMLSVTAPANAQVEDVVDLTCGPTISGPFAETGSHIVTAEGSYECGTVRPSIGVIVCLEYNGAAVACSQDVKNSARVASAGVSFPCVPGVWTATAIGVATGGLPGGAAGVAVPLDCDPLE